MNKNIRYILILLVDLIMSSVLIDFVMFGHSESVPGFRALQDRSYCKLVVDLTSIPEDFSSVAVPQSEAECLSSENLPLHEVMPALTIKGRSPPSHFSLQPASQID